MDMNKATLVGWIRDAKLLCEAFDPKDGSARCVSIQLVIGDTPWRAIMEIARVAVAGTMIESIVRGDLPFENRVAVKRTLDTAAELAASAKVSRERFGDVMYWPGIKWDGER